jgi:phosphatidylglycerophosphatase C
MTVPPRVSNDIAVFDFDHTLISVDSGTVFVSDLILRSKARTALAALAAPVAFPLLAPPRTRILGISIFLWIGTFGIGRSHFEALCSEFADAFPTRSPRGCIFGKTVEALRAHVRDGHRVIVVSGSLELLVRLMMKRLFDEDVEVIGSSVRTFFGGLVGRRHCIGKTKVEMLLEAGLPDEQWGFGYTDSALDIPLLRRCRRRFLVNPSERTIAAYRRALPDGFDVIRCSVDSGRGPGASGVSIVR